ncbi:hypothetical protein ACOMHN_002457 [Nucella lapillus]
MALPCMAVQRKLPCVYMTGVHSAPSNKRPNQPFKVTASNQLNPEVDQRDLDLACATEKVDGTCCLVQEYGGVAWLWARLDRRPNRPGEKKFQKHQARLRAWREAGQTGEAPAITWDLDKDFKNMAWREAGQTEEAPAITWDHNHDCKVGDRCRGQEVPDTWIPASGIDMVDGAALPDRQGHTPGWVPVEKKSRQYCWHLTSVDLESGLGLVLCSGETSGELVVKCRPLSELCGKTCELIGTNVNGNPYGLGSKQTPVHLLVVHGSLSVTCPSPVHSAALHTWLGGEDGEGGSKVEGVVWHCPSEALYKLHRHHLNLPWPISQPRLSQQPVTVHVDSAHFGLDGDNKSQLSLLAAVNGRRAEKLCQLHLLFNQQR